MDDEPRSLTLPGFEPAPARRREPLTPARPAPAHLAAARGLPPGVRLGTSSWSFPGWDGIVWAGAPSRERLAREGLAAYAAHPLLGAAGVDRSFYRPLAAREAAAYRDAVPSGFRFLAKAHEQCTVARFPDHPRHGALAGRTNPRFLDAAYAADAVIGPMHEGFGDTLGAVLFQFPPQSTAALGGPQRVAERLHRFLAALPAGPLVAVEIRNADWLTPSYAAALDAAGAVHCVGVHPRMPAPAVQARLAGPAMRRALVCRWNLGHGLAYEAARTRYAPFDRLVDEDPRTREALARLVLARGDGEALVVVNNKAEGSAPLSVFALAARIAALAAGG